MIEAIQKLNVNLINLASNVANILLLAQQNAANVVLLLTRVAALESELEQIKAEIPADIKDS